MPVSTSVSPTIAARSQSAQKSAQIFIIDDDKLFSDCIKSTLKKHDKTLKIKQFANALDAINSLDDLPDLIFLDVLLPGPDGFTFLNELASYPDTAKIPIVLVTSLTLPETDLSIYGIQGILNKEKMKPREVIDYVERLTR